MHELDDVAAVAAAEAVVEAVAGLTWKDGDFSSWNGHRPFRFPPPALRSCTYGADDIDDRGRSRTRSMSSSLIRPATNEV